MTETSSSQATEWGWVWEWKNKMLADGRGVDRWDVERRFYMLDWYMEHLDEGEHVDTDTVADCWCGVFDREKWLEHRAELKRSRE